MKQTRSFWVVVETEKEIPDLCDFIAQRVYNLDGVVMADAKEVMQEEQEIGRSIE